MHEQGGAGVRYAGIEAGGTKVVCAVGSGPTDLGERIVIPTSTPDETLGRVLDALRHAQAGAALAAVGIASFGPLDLDPASPGYGRVTTTPKPGWAGTDLVGVLGRGLGVPVAIDTDVNGAALAEHRWGAGRGLDHLVYVTTGTGVGAGAVVGGHPLHGMVHPEMGHLPVRRHPDDGFAGSCPFHGDCLEGMAAGPALRGRFGRPAEQLDERTRHHAVALTGWYLAQLVATVTFVLSPQRIVIGGGVLKLPGLLTCIRAQTRDLLAGAVAAPVLAGDLREYVVAPALGEAAGVLGAIALAEARVGEGTVVPGAPTPTVTPV